MRHDDTAPAPDPGAAALQGVVEASAVLAAAGQSDLVWGHVALRDPDGRGVWMKAAGWGLDEVGPAQVVLVAPDGTVLEGEGPRHIELHIHTRIMAARPEVACVVHTHAAATTAFAALGKPLRPVSHDGTLLVPPDLVRFGGTSGLIRTPELGDEVAGALGERNALLLPGHGVVTAGVDAPTAVMTAILLDRSCRMQLDIEAAGGVGVWTADEEALEKRAACWTPTQLGAGWAYLLRRARAGAPAG